MSNITRMKKGESIVSGKILVTCTVTIVEALGFRRIGVVREEYAVSADGMRMFGVMDLTSGFQG